MKRVLLVDDYMVNILIVKKLLNSNIPNLDLIHATNGKLALEKYFDAIKENNPFNIILLDIDMPEITGLEVLKIIREYEHDNKIEAVNILMLTAHNECFIESFVQYCDDFIAKPFEPKRMIYKINKYL